MRSSMRGEDGGETRGLARAARDPEVDVAEDERDLVEPEAECLEGLREAAAARPSRPNTADSPTGRRAASAARRAARKNRTASTLTPARRATSPILSALAMRAESRLTLDLGQGVGSSAWTLPSSAT